MNNRLGTVFVLFTVVIDSIGLGIIIPVIPQLIESLLGQGLAVAAIWGGALSVCFAIMQFLCSPAVGNFSDLFGRKPILLLSLLVVGIDYIIMGLTHSIWVLLLGRLIAGLAAATHSTATASIADLSSPAQRAQGFGLVGAAFGVGLILGPILGGILADFGPRTPFFAAASLALANFTFGLLIFTETLPQAHRRALSWARINPFGAFKLVGQFETARLMLAVFFIHQLAFFVYPSTWSYFVMEKFDWLPWMVGLSLSAFGVGVVVVQGGLMRWMIPKIGEARCAILGMVFSILGSLAFGLVPKDWMLFVAIPLCALSFLVVPSLQALMSQKTSPDAQGELQGVLSSVWAVASIFGPLVMTLVFWYFSGYHAPIYFPGAPFILAAILDILALMILLRLLRRGFARIRTPAP